MKNPDPDQPPWDRHESTDTLELVHGPGALAFAGWIFALLAAAAGTGIWFIPGVQNSDAWPMLAVGSLMAFGGVLLGAHLIFHRLSIRADRRDGTLTHFSGAGPMSRTRQYPLDSISAVVCEPSTERSTVLFLQLPDTRVLLAHSVHAPFVVKEGRRWAAFLGRPLQDRSGMDSEAVLRERREDRRPPAN